MTILAFNWKFCQLVFIVIFLTGINLLGFDSCEQPLMVLLAFYCADSSWGAWQSHGNVLVRWLTSPNQMHLTMYASLWEVIKTVVKLYAESTVLFVIHRNEHSRILSFYYAVEVLDKVSLIYSSNAVSHSECCWKYYGFGESIAKYIGTKLQVFSSEVLTQIRLAHSNFLRHCTS